MTKTLVTGATYAVTSATTCTVTDAHGLVLCTAEPGSQAFFVATTSTISFSDPAAVVTATFNAAPAKLMALGLLGGGATNTLPAGYLAAEFLKSSWAQAITVPSVQFDYNDTIKWVQSQLTDKETCGIFSSMNSYETCRLFIGGGNIQLMIWDRALLLRGFLNNGRRVQIDKNGITVDGSSMLFSSPATSGSREGLVIFDEFYPPIAPCEIAFHEFEVVDKVKLKPALDENGTPCMFDLIQEQPHYNIRTTPFIVGFTLPQARNLSKLPATGGTLTISLPSNWQEDEGVVNALATAEANSWVITYQTYEADASTASTFALRRIFVRKKQDENGQYVDADGTRWHVEWCAGMIGAAPTDHGYEPFRSVDAAVAYWELTPWVDPEQEELLTNSTTNEHE